MRVRGGHCWTCMRCQHIERLSVSWFSCYAPLPGRRLKRKRMRRCLKCTMDSHEKTKKKKKWSVEVTFHEHLGKPYEIQMPLSDKKSIFILWLKQANRPRQNHIKYEAQVREWKTVVQCLGPMLLGICVGWPVFGGQYLLACQLTNIWDKHFQAFVAVDQCSGAKLSSLCDSRPVFGVNISKCLLL